MSRTASSALTNIAILLAIPSAFAANPKCDALERELELATNTTARERAAIADLKSMTMKPIREAVRKGEITNEKHTVITDINRAAFDCLEQDNNLKEEQAYFTKQSNAIAAGCDTSSITDTIRKSLAQKESYKARACSKANNEVVAAFANQIKEIMDDKAASEEKETPAVTQTDVSQRNGPFCEQIRSISAQAPTLFKSITGAKLERDFIPEMKEFGIPRVKISEIADVESYATPISLTAKFLSTSASCEISIGTFKDIAFRVEPQYECQWEYKRTLRRDLEERADILLNRIRGCFTETTEAADKLAGQRHHFIGDKSVRVTSHAYFGEGKPSSIYLSISKYTPQEDDACARYSINRKAEDGKLCRKKHPQ